MRRDVVVSCPCSAASASAAMTAAAMRAARGAYAERPLERPSSALRCALLGRMLGPGSETSKNECGSCRGQGCIQDETAMTRALITREQPGKRLHAGETSQIGLEGGGRGRERDTWPQQGCRQQVSKGVMTIRDASITRDGGWPCQYSSNDPGCGEGSTERLVRERREGERLRGNERSRSGQGAERSNWLWLARAA